MSAGVCHGKVIVLGKKERQIPKYPIHSQQTDAEVQRFEQGLVETREQLIHVQQSFSNQIGSEDARIFDAHLLILEDPTLIDPVIRKIRDDRVNVEQAFHAVSEQIAAVLESADDEYLRERAVDMRDVAERVLGKLLGEKDGSTQQIDEPRIIVSHDLTPSTTATLPKDNILGIATDVGSMTSHTAIIARSLKIPAVVGLRDISQSLKSGQYVLLDGHNGRVVLNPSDQSLYTYGEFARRQEDLEHRLKDLRDQPAVTLDGHRIKLSSNLDKPKETEDAKKSGAEGVGLFRTEYFFLNRDQPPTEEEQFHAYQKVASDLTPEPVLIRTLDLGGDKLDHQTRLFAEANPALGCRAIRYCLLEKEVFRSQLRAVLRASVEGNLRLMYPMISSLEELLQANALLEECKQQLRQQGVPFNENLEVGVMVETPSAAMIADTLAAQVKFFSIGTNDLIQYALAVDRMNESIAGLYNPTHPGILKLIHLTVRAAKNAGIWVGVCGEMAGEPTLVPLLLGLGVDELSAACPLIPKVKYLIRRLKLAEAIDLAEFALKCPSSEEILRRSRELTIRVAPQLFEDQKESDG